MDISKVRRKKKKKKKKNKNKSFFVEPTEQDNSIVAPPRKSIDQILEPIAEISRDDEKLSQNKAAEKELKPVKELIS